MTAKNEPEKIETRKIVFVRTRDNESLLFFAGEKHLSNFIKFLQRKKFIERIKQIKKPSMTIIYIHPTQPGLMRSITADAKRHAKAAAR